MAKHHNRQLAIGNRKCLQCPSLESRRFWRSPSSCNFHCAVWAPLVIIDFPLVIVVYIALQREAWQSLIAATIAGLAIDASSGTILGAGGIFKNSHGLRSLLCGDEGQPGKSISANSGTGGSGSVTRRWFMSVCIVPGAAFAAPFVQTLAYSVIGTMVVRTVALLMLDNRVESVSHNSVVSLPIVDASPDAAEGVLGRSEAVSDCQRKWQFGNQDQQTTERHRLKTKLSNRLTTDY